ncbi:MAG TPA: oxaloacetate decarboxylase subunit alpha [Candidatus Krumholzibacteriaceae bacterium]|jgi:oxaloacetate decarboxylase alpha subunit|nr:oxaloacetate decarboxylase subunit alpha [Candidatus Krumholzibacteriaceae bacterium]
MTNPVKITDTTLRDAHQSLMATRMRTETMLNIAEKMDNIGFWSLEMWGGATFDVCIRFLNEDPWQRLKTLKKTIKKTRLQMLLRGQNIVGYRNYADDVVTKFIEKAAQNGIDVFRVFDAVNDVRNVETAIKAVKKIGAHAQGTICYTVSPVHTTEHYLKVANQLAELECDSICIKDMAGLLAPQTAYELVSTLKKKTSLPIHLHCHSTSGMALMTYQKACEANVDILDTSFSPFAWGTSQPPVETLVAALQNTPRDPHFDMALLVEIAEYFRNLREKYYDPMHLIDPMAERIDTSILMHQIPGGMFSNLISQLKEQNAVERLKEVLAEVPKVRKDLGYPPLVTPTSQIVGTQAVLNVISGERYKIVPKEVKDYVKGLYGKPPAPISEKIKKKVIGDEEIITQRPANLLKPELGNIPEEAKPYLKSEEDQLTYILFPKAAIEFFKKRETKQEDKLTQLSTEEREELERVAAVSAAIAVFASSTKGVKAVIPVRKTENVSFWTLTSRQGLLKQGGYID